MQLFIKTLVLWPRNSKFQVRTIDFSRGKINLITGRSGSGKSAILDIVDYVLGSSKCAIPVGYIRDTVAWYGAVLELNGVTMLVARREPGEQAQSSEYFITEALAEGLPRQLTKNSSLPSFKGMMDRAAGLPSIGFEPDPEQRGRYSARPGFRDMAAFNFLPQHIVANPYALFYKADTAEHRKRLTTIFPLVLGAVEAKHLEAEHELDLLLRQQRRLEAELRQRVRSAELWRGEVAALYVRALELGLVEVEGAAPVDTNGYIVVLAAIPERVATVPPRAVRAGATVEATRQLQAVRDKEQAAASSLRELRLRLARIQSLKTSTSGLDTALASSASRVQGVGWLKQHVVGGSGCPVCFSDSDAAKRQLVELGIAAEQLVEQQHRLNEIPVALQKEEGDLKRQSTELENALREIRLQRVALEAKREEAGGQRLDQVYRFVGRIEQSLINLAQTKDSGDLVERLEAIRVKTAELEGLLNPMAKKRRLAAALAMVTAQIGAYAQFMDLERARDSITLVLSELTLRFQGVGTSRQDYLWELGSGANWMGYHISAFVALHLFFLRREISHVPTFLFVDQPSQVYFPSGVGQNEDAQSPDVIATRRIFEALEAGLIQSDYELQIVVVEHADERTITGVKTLHKVADWHKEPNGLIPQAWIDALP